ncbi:S41 family peptidase [Bdellovibrio sp. ZAP7]|uniref:S41 family peptidase n=1 Tax=Bdellovibrio sp. ZAP7 TaxID=2231053 RepID=UPI001AF011AA|nr:S41 family peptidase [Bdellovibrio sp. ZAP7]
MASDVGLLIQALEYAYPAKWIMSSDSWADVLQKIKAVHFEENVSNEVFGSALADILWQIPDGHLAVKLDGKVLGEFLHIQTKMPSTGHNLVSSGSNLAWNVEQRKSATGVVSIVAISHFPPSSDPQWFGFSEAIRGTLDSSAVIVDLRGNVGGDDAKGIEMVSILLGRELEMDWVQEVVCETAESLALQINTYELIIWNRYTSKNITPPAELTDHLDSLKGKANALALGAKDGGKVVVDHAPRSATSETTLAFKNKIFVLVDPVTASSGEWAALYLKRHPNAVIVGENTRGMIHFGNSGLLYLPHSGLCITLCMKINDLTDGRFFERTGIVPDMRIANRDSLEYVLSLGIE